MPGFSAKSFKISNSFTVGTIGFRLGGTARPLHVKNGATGYNVAPWTDTSIFSSIIYDL